MIVSSETQTEYSARILARDNDGNIWLPLGCVEIGPWSSEVRWVEDPIDQMWFHSRHERDAAVAQVNPGYSKYHIVGRIELLSRITTTEVIASPQ